MEPWQKTALILCGFGLFKEFRPSEPFVTEYLLDFKNISQDDLVHIAFPVSTYTCLGTLAIVFLVTDVLRYRSVIIFEGIAYVITWIFMIWGKSLSSLIVVEIFYGIAGSTEVAYYTYIYAKVDRENYQKVTSYTYSAIFAGRFLGGVAGQLLVSFDLMDFHQLNYISLTCVSTACVFALFLPPVNQSLYFHRIESTASTDTINNDNEPITTPPIKTNTTLSDKVKNTQKYLWVDFKDGYSNTNVLKWSIWWAVATSGHLQAINYTQALWETIVAADSNVDGQLYNGAVEAVHTLLSATLAFGVGHVNIPWSKWGESFLSIVSLAQGGLLFLMSRTDNLYIAYVSYILFRMFYQVVITIASAEVAKRIREDSYALIFGINTFLALGIQTILTLVVTDDMGLRLDERTQFLVYGGYHALLGLLFVAMAIFAFIRHRFKKGSEEPESVNVTE